MNKKKYNWKKDIEECAYDSKEEFLWIYIMKGCGCGSADELRCCQQRCSRRLAVAKGHYGDHH